MDFSSNFSPDGFEMRLKVNWQRLRAFAQNLVFTIWAIAALLLALKAAGIDVPAWLGF